MEAYDPCMNTKARRRITISMPETTVRLLDEIVPKSDRSTFINEAVQAYVASSRARLRRELKAGARVRAARDLAIVAEWSALDADSWPRSQEVAPRRSTGTT